MRQTALPPCIRDDDGRFGRMVRIDRALIERITDMSGILSAQRLVLVLLLVVAFFAGRVI
jgi:hypothetical protein